MASNVTPSIPGAPSFCLAIAYAARRVSILQTWTYSPQKRQDGSAFALTYKSPPQVLQFDGRLYHLVLAFLTLETLQMAGPLRSTDITPLPHYSGPSRHPLVFGRLLGVAGSTAYFAQAISRRDVDGFSISTACPCHLDVPL